MSGTPSIDRLGELAAFSVDAVVLLDAAGVIQSANAAALDVLGYRADDLAGIQARDLVEPVDRDGWRQLFDRLFDEPAAPVRGTFRCRHRDGSIRWTEAVARNLLQEPRLASIIVFYRDVSSTVIPVGNLREWQLAWVTREGQDPQPTGKPGVLRGLELSFQAVVI